MRKATLSRNPAMQAKQLVVFQGIPASGGIITRDSIEIAIETSDRPDGTKIPIGRTNPGEFSMSIDFADYQTLQIYEEWYNQALDASRSLPIPTEVGIDPEYKRDGTLVYYRLYNDSSTENLPIVYRLFGCFLTSMTLPDYDMSGSDAVNLEINVSYDDVTRGSLEDAQAAITRAGALTAT